MKYIQVGKDLEHELFESKDQLKHLKFEKFEGEHIVTLVDLEGFEIIKGYGETVINAINDLHFNLL